MSWYSLFSPLTSCIHIGIEYFCALKCFSYEVQFALHLASEWKHRSNTTTTIQTTDPKQPNKKRKVMRSFQANNIERRIAIRHQSGMASASAHNLPIQMSIKCFRNFLLSLRLLASNYLLQVFSIYHSTLWGICVCVRPKSVARICSIRWHLNALIQSEQIGNLGLRWNRTNVKRQRRHESFSFAGDCFSYFN